MPCTIVLTDEQLVLLLAWWEMDIGEQAEILAQTVWDQPTMDRMMDIYRLLGGTRTMDDIADEHNRDLGIEQVGLHVAVRLGRR